MTIQEFQTSCGAIEQEYKNKIGLCIAELDSMRSFAETHGKENFSYNNIAKRSVGIE